MAKQVFYHSSLPFPAWMGGWGVLCWLGGGRIWNWLMQKLFLLTTGIWRVWLAYNTDITAMTVKSCKTRWAVWAIQYVLLVSQTSIQIPTIQPHGTHSGSIHGITSRYHSVRKSKLSTYYASCSWTESVIPIGLGNRSPDTFDTKFNSASVRNWRIA